MNGASDHEVREESLASKKMVEEVHSQGLEMYDLTDPKVYKKYFGF
jgi:hypothetical protein